MAPTNKRLGSCIECGGAIFENDLVNKDAEDMRDWIYKCLKCKRQQILDEIIPF